MHRRSRRNGLHNILRPSPVLALLAALALSAGCEEERNVGTKPGASASAPKQPEFIVGKRTQVIKNAAPELEKGGAKVATTKITAKDYITLQGNAYVTQVGRLGVLQIEHAMNL